MGGWGIIYRSAKGSDGKTTFGKEDITKRELSTNRGRFPQKTRVFPQQLCHFDVMSRDRGLECFVVESLSDLKQVAEQGSISIDVAANLLVSMEDSAVVSTAQLPPDVGPGALQFLPEKVHRHLACHREGPVSLRPLD